jgi:drug/metabolite transporter (DMT)-like permease
MSEKIKIIDTGVLFMLASSVLGALNGAVAKYLSQSMDPLEIVFYRNLIGVFIILFTLKKLNWSGNINSDKEF